MTSKDIYLIETLKKDIQEMVNHYISRGIPAYAQLTIFNDAVRSLVEYANADIANAEQENCDDDIHVDEIVSATREDHSETERNDLTEVEQ